MNSSYNQYFNSHSHPPKSPQQDHPIKDTTKGKKSKGGVRLSTDPQSVAARERRHRISHRLKTLQTIVPGGAKLDTVTLLDHAIHYVHFLNSQIRFHQYCLLLSMSSAAMAVDHACLLPPDSCFSSSSVDRNVYVGPPGDSFDVVDPSRFLPPLPPAAEYDREDCDHGCFCVDVSDGTTSVVDF